MGQATALLAGFQKSNVRFPPKADARSQLRASDSPSASSTSTPRYLTVLSNLADSARQRPPRNDPGVNILTNRARAITRLLQVAANTDPALYDVLSRRFYVSVTAALLSVS